MHHARRQQQLHLMDPAWGGEKEEREREREGEEKKGREERLLFTLGVL